jgi:hypothetical protein
MVTSRHKLRRRSRHYRRRSSSSSRLSDGNRCNRHNTGHTIGSTRSMNRLCSLAWWWSRRRSSHPVLVLVVVSLSRRQPLIFRLGCDVNAGWYSPMTSISSRRKQKGCFPRPGVEDGSSNQISGKNGQPKVPTLLLDEGGSQILRERGVDDERRDVQESKEPFEISALEPGGSDQLQRRDPFRSHPFSTAPKGGWLRERVRDQTRGKSA